MSTPAKEYLIRFDATKCTQCHGCEIACKTWRDLPYGIRYRRVLNLWDGSYPKVKCTSLSLSCLHCTDPACAAVCPADAITKSETDGRVLVDKALCTGCRACADACPFGVPQFGDDDIMQKCDLCFDQPLSGADPPCVDTCPGKALTLTHVSPTEKKVQGRSVLNDPRR
jgi:anaerobic dimethyl sulfoxide reductase subunit B